MNVGAVLELEIEKPAAGGRMLARHHGQVVLVWGAIPGERVRARVDRLGKGVVYGETVDVLAPSPDRRVSTDWRCGGSVLSHIGYERQRTLKGEIIRDALSRIGRVTLSAPPDVMGSPEHGYRMRARLHARDGRLGFFREESHDLCDATATGQLLETTNGWLTAVAGLMRAADGVAALELAENVAGDERACHLDLHDAADIARVARLADAGPLTGLSIRRADRAAAETLVGTPAVVDVLEVTDGAPASALRLGRDVRSFFQGNRYLLTRLLRHVVALVPPGPVVELYAGVGLFGLALAASGREAVTLVEGDPVSGADLQHNAEPFEDRARIERRSVESFLRFAPAQANATFIVDPPRTGLSKDAVAGVVAQRPPCILYVSCDVATLARDARILLDAGYALDGLTGLDLFPNTAHVETVATFVRSRRRMS